MADPPINTLHRRGAESPAERDRSFILSTVGWMIVAAGIAWMGYALQFDTTVHSLSGGEVHNNGLLNDRVVYMLAAGFTLLFGVGVLLLGRSQVRAGHR